MAFKKQFCKRGHDTALCGRMPDSRCRDCTRQHARDFRAELKASNPERWRKISKENNWKGTGITNADNTPFRIVDYDRIYQIQQGRCALCNRHQSELPESFCADHDHTNGIIRGLLCRRCNSRINIFDDKEYTKAVTQYLKIKIVEDK